MSKNDYISAFREIRKARENNKLVIFVGAGISKNSNLPSWKELIEEFAEEIQYSPYVLNKDNYRFSTDEFLKIPQYAFDKDSKSYFEILERILNVPAKSNSLNEIILKLLPNHIITTNYDKLIENTGDLNNLLYKVVSSDKDLLISQGEHYIIKMHGDIDDLSNIVLKENDYLNYTNNHILLETFIKSLLVDHIFLFVGYSLNDYNLKQIMSWIDYLSSKESVIKSRHKNFIIQDGKINDYELNYWENRKLTIIDSSALDKDLVKKYKKDDLEKGVASRLYSCLEIINDENTDIYFTDYDEYLLDMYKVFNMVEKIYIDDLLKVSGITNVHFNNGTLDFYDEDTYKKWEGLVDNKRICDYWIKAGIERLNNFQNKKSDFVTLQDIDQSRSNSIIDELLELLVNFQYESIEKVLKKESLPEQTKYYYKAQLSMNDPEVRAYYFNPTNTNANNSISNFNLAIYNYNSFLFKKLSHESNCSKNDVLRFIGMFSKQEKRAYSYLSSIIHDGSDLKQVNQFYSFLSKTESSYLSPPLFTSERFGKLPEIRSSAYQHFFFFKKNGILLDNFSETEDFFESYIKCMLITQKEIRQKDQGFGPSMSLQKYPLGLIDINIIVLFARYTNIKKYLRQENISRIMYEKDFDLISLFENFCMTIIYVLKKNNFIFPGKFLNFSVLLRYSNLLDKDMERLVPIIEILLKNERFNNFMLSHNEIERELLDLLLNVVQGGCDVSIEIIVLLIKNLSKEAREGYTFSKIMSYLAQNTVYSKSRKIQLSISKTRKIKQFDKMEWNSFLVTMYPIMSNNLKKRYSKEIKENYMYIDSFKLIDVVSMDIINFDDKLKSKYVEQIKDAAERKKSGFSSYPDPLEVAIESSIILHLLGKIEDIEYLRECTSYSEYLKFIFYPRSFDYSQLDLDDYMWINFLKNDKYRKIIVKNGKKEIEAKAIKNLKLGIASEDQKKVFYKYFVDDNDFWRY
ncbi:SIR2 family protein [Enterococcus malodoratus]|uniref:Uncharacterized protein n=1 Tax=Enterococcus malodoratus ATCC 43197 TaxID=1158601 RepID=R2QUC7_9ENTE|nr:SIR2 family protein [Enterococcus malodoratus]EOH72106.1 hypothetical protein UAI_04390 [Enterococcus malodoratus ATCC 43197]EOT69870.1 hypothetical protein I585_01349 [Enterococcus malodoratus ATCC 43197]OJG56486.1 hypothetical protein RV07_GL004115 [Enterococcus malodoratus]SPX01495.1 Uncharacterised protein [Enterococcus malodoratus]STC70774.1 Uncharacterised protein [Enterococcus malodoratus]